MMRHNDVEDDENDCFYESFDRLVSSSSCYSSASNSDHDYDSEPSNSDSLPLIFSTASHESGADGSRRRRRRDPLSVPQFPMTASGFDVWISEPASVSKRRSKLLREMGLSRDTVLRRSKPHPADSAAGEFGFSSYCSISTSSSEVSRGDHGECSTCVGGGALCRMRSKPHDSGSQTDRNPRYTQRNSHSVSYSDSQINISPAVVYSDCVSDSDKDNLAGGSVEIHPAIVCEETGEFLRLNGNPPTDSCDLRNPSYRLVDNESRSTLSEQVCTIKNLDNGKEFIVNEIQEDGTWKQLREVGTGRQLTMEEFEICVGHCPIVQELMRRQSVEDACKNAMASKEAEDENGNASTKKKKKKGSWLKSIKNVASSMTGNKGRQSSDDRDTSSDRGGRRSSSATDDSRDSSFHRPERIRVKQYGKSCKELTALYKTQEIQAHNGSIWSIKFSLDGKYLASAGEDCIVRIWKVIDAEKKGELLLDRSEPLILAKESPELNTPSPRWKGRASVSRKSTSSETIKVPDSVFGLSEKPFCSFRGHSADVLDLSWSESQHLLSSSMDKTVRLWHLSSQTCLKVFSHSDYVTCIQFNPVDDRYFISGSLDAKVRVWSIPDHLVVDWYDLHEMVTAACYTPNGQGALAGSYKGSCRVYSMSDNKLQEKSKVNLQNRKKMKKAHQKKITGFQFVPGSSSEVLITSSDSRIRVVDDDDLVYKLKGFRNASSQISASITSDAKYIVSASEDSNVYVWKYELTSRPGRSNKGVMVTNSYEHFHSQDVSVAITWPGMSAPNSWEEEEAASTANHPPNHVNQSDTNSPRSVIISTWPEEKHMSGRTQQSRSPRVSTDMSNMSAWNMVIVTAGLRGEIQTFHNFGLPIRI